MAREGAPSLARRERAAVLGALAGISVLAWVYLVRRAADMGSGVMSMDMDMAGLASWDAIDFALTLLMWAVMMIGMMVPSAMPATLVYAGIVRKARRDGDVVAPTLVFVSGYVVTWVLFSLGATAAQFQLEQLALLSPMMTATTPLLGAGLLIVAGAYQLTPAKRACLSHCRSPVHFIARHWRRGIGGALRMGAVHGLYCVGCCWALMLLLFAGGVMNLVWVAAIAFFVLLEKVLPLRGLPSRIAGAALIASGLVLLARGV
jgi:predicted metal-binding membrane protein